MIRAVFKKDRDGYIYSLNVSGHGENITDSGGNVCNLLVRFATLFSCKLFRERNIICSGVSALTQMVVLGVADVVGEGFTVEKESGLVSFDIPESYIRDERIQILLNSLERSFRKINLKYGESIIIGSEKDG